MNGLRMFLKKTFFAGLAAVLLIGLLVVSCGQPADGSDPVNAGAPSISGQPQGGNWNVTAQNGGTFTLTVTANSPDGGNLSYQWYENTTNSTADGIVIGTGNPLTLDKASYLYNQDHYFYVVVTNTITDNGDGGKKTATAASSVVKVTVSGNLVNARSPNITGQPTGGTWDVTAQNGATFTLTVTAASTDNGQLSYQWHRGASASPAAGDSIIGTDDETLTLEKEHFPSNGHLYIYVVVTNTIDDNEDDGNKIATAISNVATVTVTGNEFDMVDAELPIITGQPTGGSWNVNSNFTLTVTASVTDGGSLSYQWYENTSNSTTGGTEIGEDDDTLTLVKTNYAGGAYYFYVVVTNTIDDNHDGGVKSATATSHAAKVTIPINAQQPNITGQPNGGSWNVGSANTFPLTVTANKNDGGTLSYQWYSNTTGLTTSGTAVPGGTSATLSLAKADYAFNAAYHFYVVVTNTLIDNGDGGQKTAVVTSSAATVTVTGGINAIPIASQADMAKIGVDGSHPLSGNYLLTSDITLTNWPPIGSSTAPFTGVFNGGGNKITLNGFTSAAVSGNYLGIFSYVKGASASAKAGIKNLEIVSAVNATVTNANNQNAGLVTGYAELAEIENITLSGVFNFQSDKLYNLGGAAGVITGDGTIVKNCSSSMTMNIIPATGTGGNATYIYVGGFVGQFQNGAGIEKCHNAGDVTADNVAHAENGQVFVGGITGGSPYGFSTSGQGYIRDSSFTGTLIGRASGLWTFAGGIAATICGGTTANIATTTRIERCFVTGTVSVAGTASGNPYVGGIVGYIYQGALASQCYFAGDVIADKSGDYTGGIAGYNSRTTAPNTSRVEDCWSSGTVTGYGNAGGITGRNEAGAAVKNCYSTTVVSALSAGTGVGGISGLHGATDLPSSVTACVALNPLLTVNSQNNINRVTGTFAGTLSNNHAWTGMAIRTGTGTYTERKGLAAADGADLNTQTPAQSVYQGLGWDFTNVWKMGSAGFPLLKWQDETSGAYGSIDTINIVDPPEIALDNRNTITITTTVTGSLKKGTGSTINFQGSLSNATYVWYLGTEIKKTGGTILNARQWNNVSVDSFATGTNIITAVVTVNGAPWSGSTVVVVEGE
jgi:hypothetical protein